MFQIGLHYAFRNVLRTPLRSFFTIFSIAMIISLYTLLTAVADSFADQMKGLMHQENVDIVIQSKFSTTPLSSSISPQVVTQIAHIAEVKSMVGIVLGRKRFEDRNMVYLFGISNISQVANKLGLSLFEGRLNEPDKQELIVAQRVLKNQQLKVGDSLSFPQQNPLKIVGSFHSWISFFNSSVICDLECARKILGKKDKTNMLFLSLKDPRDTDQIIAKLSEKYPAIMPIKSGEFSSTGVVKNMFYLSDIVALVTLIIASAILINTFLIAVHERTKEIGILHAIGWSQGMVVYIFIAESLLLALTGGLLGFVSSIGFLEYLKVAYNDINIYLPTSLDAGMFLYSLLVCTLIAIISAVFPALHASKINIARALSGD